MKIGVLVLQTMRSISSIDSRFALESVPGWRHGRHREDGFVVGEPMTALDAKSSEDLVRGPFRKQLYDIGISENRRNPSRNTPGDRPTSVFVRPHPRRCVGTLIGNGRLRSRGAPGSSRIGLPSDHSVALPRRRSAPERSRCDRLAFCDEDRLHRPLPPARRDRERTYQTRPRRFVAQPAPPLLA